MATAQPNFQRSVSLLQGFGVPGEVFQDAPWVVLSYRLESDSTPNIIGATAYTITSQGVAEAGAGGTLGFAGILCSPKDHALFGTSDGPLYPTLTLADGTQAQLLTQGIMIVTLPEVAEIGDYVIYDDTTGELATQAPGDTLTAGFSFANAIVSQFSQDTSGGGLAVIQVIPVINPIPTPAP